MSNLGSASASACCSAQTVGEAAVAVTPEPVGLRRGRYLKVNSSSPDLSLPYSMHSTYLYDTFAGNKRRVHTTVGGGYGSERLHLPGPGTLGLH